MNYDKNEMFGALRSGLLQLRRAAISAEESWAENEIMLNPRECADLATTIRDYKNELRRVEGISKKFCTIADSRIAA